MGDWVNPEIKTALDRGTVKAIAFPGTEGTFVFTSDTFPLPIDAPYPDETLQLLETIASVDAQVKFSALKGSIPARRDALAVLGDDAVQRGAAFGAAHKVLATSGFFPPYYPSDRIYTAIERMVEPTASSDTVAAVVRELEDAVPLFAKWQRSLSEGPSPPLPSAP